MPVPFTHRDAGTDETTWLLNARWDDVPRVRLAGILRRHPRVVLIAPHPDDESLALGATLADLAAAGTAVTVVVATHGGDGPGATVRRSEGDRALRALSSRIEVIWWDLPDSGLAEAQDALRAGLAGIVDASTLVFAPVECDGHSDHDAVARAAEDVALDRSAALLLYPVWLWHWATPADVDWSRLRTLAPSLRGLQAKRDAIDCHGSQLASADGHPIVGSGVLARARRVTETVMVPLPRQLAARVADDVVPARRGRDEVAQPFEAMYDADDDDPWNLDGSQYERRRHELVLACLGRDHYGRAIEIGCATGQLASRLRDRADDVVGLDASVAALRVAGQRSDAVRWVLGAAPHDVPDEDYDLIVMSEIGYFLDGVDLLATLRGLRRRLRPDGELVIANWRGPTEDIPLDGATVQQQAVAMLDLPVRAHYEDADLVIDVWGHPISVHGESR